jgi:exosortase A
VSAIPAAIVAHRPWRSALAALALAIAAILFLYRGTAVGMVQIWARSDTFAHAFLVLPISAWLVWRIRDRVAALTPQPMPWALAPMAAVGLMWLVGDSVHVNAATQFALVGMLVLAVPAVLGWAVTREVLFPLLFLFFAVPFGEFMLPWMMDWTADFTIAALELSGVPVYREGLQFVIPSGQWSVVEACSGVRYLIASLMVGTLFAYLNYRSQLRRWIFAGVSILVPIVANWLRAYMIVMLGHLSNNRIAVGVDHLVYGWVFFGVVIGLMFFIGARWSEPEPPAPAAAAAGAMRVATVEPTAAWWPVVSAMALVVAAWPHALLWSVQRGAATLPPPKVVLPERLGGDWLARGKLDIDWTPRFTEPSAEVATAYRAGNRDVGVYVAYYRDQNYKRKLVTSENVLIKSLDKTWNQAATGQRTVRTQAGELIVRTAQLRTLPTITGVAAKQITVWRVYWAGGGFTASDAWAKIRTAAHALTGRGDDGAALVFYAAGDDTAEAQAALEAFVAGNLHTIAAAFEQARSGR